MDQVVAEGGLKAFGQVEPLLLGLNVEAVPVPVVGSAFASLVIGLVIGCRSMFTRLVILGAASASIIS